MCRKEVDVCRMEVGMCRIEVGVVYIDVWYPPMSHLCVGMWNCLVKSMQIAFLRS